MCKRYPVAIQAVVRHQQPAGQTFLYLAASVGESRLRRLDHERVAVAQEKAVQGRIFFRELAELAGGLCAARRHRPA